MNLSLCARWAVAGVLMLSSSSTWAGIQLGGTRLILQAPAKEAPLPTTNQGSEDIMIQSWIEANDASVDVPFVITPTLVRMEAGKQQTLRVIYQGQGLPTDKESVFWLSVQEIPQKPKDDNVLQLALRQRIKLFYRPQGLAGTALQAPAALTWRWVDKDGQQGLQVSNPSAYHVSLSSVTLRGNAGELPMQVQMIAPGATQLLVPESDGTPAQATGMHTVAFENVNDYGGVDQHSAVLAP